MENVIEMQKFYGLHKILMSRRKTFDVIIHRINFDIMDKRIIISMIIVFLLGFSFSCSIVEKERSSTATKKVLDKLNTKDPMDAVFDTLNYK